MHNERTIHNDVYQYQLQMQASYYQLHYFQQQQMMNLMRNSTTRRLSKQNKPPLSPSSSNVSLATHRRNSRSQSRPGSPLTPPQQNPITEPERPNVPKRRESLGKRIKRVFGLKGNDESATRNEPLKVETCNSPGAKNTHPSVTDMPDSPISSVSSSSYGRYSTLRQFVNTQLPSSPASSTVSFRKGRKISFNPAVQLHETFSPEDYDRRSDVNSTCQKLTPALAIKIKEDLNNFKLKEMYVHPDSRNNTHFFM
jgi:hypothetical protein